jgi:hypothetical protein
MLVLGSARVDCLVHGLVRPLLEKGAPLGTIGPQNGERLGSGPQDLDRRDSGQAGAHLAGQLNGADGSVGAEFGRERSIVRMMMSVKPMSAKTATLSVVSTVGPSPNTRSDQPDRSSPSSALA